MNGSTVGRCVCGHFVDVEGRALIANQPPNQLLGVMLQMYKQKLSQPEAQSSHASQSQPLHSQSQHFQMPPPPPSEQSHSSQHQWMPPPAVSVGSGGGFHPPSPFHSQPLLQSFQNLSPSAHSAMQTRSRGGSASSTASFASSTGSGSGSGSGGSQFGGSTRPPTPPSYQQQMGAPLSYGMPPFSSPYPAHQPQPHHQPLSSQPQSIPLQHHQQHHWPQHHQSQAPAMPQLMRVHPPQMHPPSAQLLSGSGGGAGGSGFSMRPPTTAPASFGVPQHQLPLQAMGGGRSIMQPSQTQPHSLPPYSGGSGAMPPTASGFMPPPMHPAAASGRGAPFGLDRYR